MLWRRGELCFSAKNQTSPVGPSSPWPVAVPNVTEVKPVTFGVLNVLLQLLCEEQRTTAYKFSEESPVCEKKKTNWKYEYCEHERGMLTSECVLFKIHWLFCIIMKRSVLLLLLPVSGLLLRYCPENRIPVYKKKKNSKRTM